MEQQLDTGLVKGHAYGISAVRTIKLGEGFFSKFNAEKLYMVRKVHCSSFLCLTRHFFHYASIYYRKSNNTINNNKHHENIKYDRIFKQLL